MAAADEFEVYPNAPLQLVAFELRYPFSPRLGMPEAIAFFDDQLGEILPIVEPLGQQVFMFVGGRTDQEVPPTTLPTSKSLFRLTSRARTTAITVSGENAIIETSNYERYGKFRPLVKRVLDALGLFGHPVGVERIGLRYIDELRVPSITAPPGNWAPYIHPSLLAAKDLGEAAHPELKPSSWQGVLEFARGDRMAAVMRYGALNGNAVNPDGPLRLAKRQEPGPFFLIDVDSFWAAQPEDEVGEFSPDHVLELCDSLHRPVRALFELAITENLRDEVLRRGA